MRALSLALQKLTELDLSALQVLNLFGICLKKDSPKIAFVSGSVKTSNLSLPAEITSIVGIEQWSLPKLKVLDIRRLKLSGQDIGRLQYYFGPEGVVLAFCICCTRLILC